MQYIEIVRRVLGSSALGVPLGSELWSAELPINNSVALKHLVVFCCRSQQRQCHVENDARNRTVRCFQDAIWAN